MDTPEDALAEAWRLLADGVRDRHAAFHLAQVATVTSDRRPAMRTVVLRAADPEARLLRFHTDRRSGKVRELHGNPAIGILFHDAALKTTVRINGSATVHTDDAVASAAWAESRPFSRACYLAEHTPGTVVAVPPPAPVYQITDDDRAYGNFCAVVTTVHRLEWLNLAATGHRRAVFTWHGDQNPPTMSWVSP